MFRPQITWWKKLFHAWLNEKIQQRYVKKFSKWNFTVSKIVWIWYFEKVERTTFTKTGANASLTSPDILLETVDQVQITCFDFSVLETLTFRVSQCTLLSLFLFLLSVVWLILTLFISHCFVLSDFLPTFLHKHIGKITPLIQTSQPRGLIGRWLEINEEEPQTNVDEVWMMINDWKNSWSISETFQQHSTSPGRL